MHRRVGEQGIVLEVGTPENRAEVLAFVAREFPSWAAAYQSVATLGDHADVLLARDGDEHIIRVSRFGAPLRI